MLAAAQFAHSHLVARVSRDDGALAARLRDAALRDVQRYAWSAVRQQWLAVYASVRPGGTLAQGRA